MHFNNLLSSFSIFFFFLSILSSLQSSSLNATSLIPDTCTKISKSDSNVEYEFCVATLASDPRSATVVTVAQLGSISFRLGVSKTISISSQIAKISKDPKLGPSAKGALKACTEVYVDAQHALQEGLKAFEKGDYPTSNARANAALSVPTACENAFEVSPLTKENSDFFQLASISLDFTDLLHNG